ncbi:MAG TPA: hypothetical protein VFZ43_12565 [Anaerolineales bacterium]
MILYKKVFPLGKGVSFSLYINTLRRKYFPHYVLTIDNISSTENYRVQIFFTAPLWRWGLANAFLEGVLLKECTIQYSNGENHLTLEASPKTGNLFITSSYVITAILFFVFAIFMIATNGGMSFNNILGFVIIIIVFLAPLASTYLRGKKLLDKVGSIGR